MKKIKIAIVGLNFGKTIIKQLKDNKYFEIAGVCDLVKKKADQEAKKIGAKAYYNIDDLLEDDDIPTVGLYTGPIGRSKLIRKVIRAGKDVMTTKPFELNAEEALEVLKEAEDIGRIIHLNSPSPFPEDIAVMKDWIKKYNLGQPVGCRSDVWACYREEADGRWHDDRDKCPAAPIFRLGIYLINDLLRLIGKPESVQVMHSRLFTKRPTPDNAQLGILFENGALANIYASFCIGDGQPYSNTLTLNFERGTIYRNVGSRDSEQVKLNIVYDSGNGYKKEEVYVDKMSGEYQWAFFYKAVKGEKITNSVSPELVVRGVKVINAMSRAEKSGCTEVVLE